MLQTQTVNSMPNSMRVTAVEAVDQSAATKLVREAPPQTEGSNLDIAFLHSDALVINDKKKGLQPLPWKMTLSPEEMFEDMTMELESNP